MFGVSPPSQQLRTNRILQHHVLGPLIFFLHRFARKDGGVGHQAEDIIRADQAATQGQCASRGYGFRQRYVPTQKCWPPVSRIVNKSATYVSNACRQEVQHPPSLIYMTAFPLE